MNSFLIALIVFLSGGAFFMWLGSHVLRPWARKNLGRPLEQDLWGLPKKEEPKVEKGYCDYPKCTSKTNSDWDTRCIEHSWRVDGGRP